MLAINNCNRVRFFKYVKSSGIQIVHTGIFCSKKQKYSTTTTTTNNNNNNNKSGTSQFSYFNVPLTAHGHLRTKHKFETLSPQFKTQTSKSQVKTWLTVLDTQSVVNVLHALLRLTSVAVFCFVHHSAVSVLPPLDYIFANDIRICTGICLGDVPFIAVRL